MEIYEPNSRKYKEEQATTATTDERKKLDKVVNGTVKTKKKSKISKFFGNIVSDDATSIKSYIVSDVVIPSVKKAITETIDMILYGDSRKSRTNASKISYKSYYDRSYSEPRSYSQLPPVKTGYSFDDIVLESRGDAEQVLSQMNDLIDTYGVASVADLFDLVGISGNYTDNKYGWTNLRNAEVKRSRDGYVLDMPKALPIK